MTKISEILSQNKPFFFCKLFQEFCHRDRKLMNTEMLCNQLDLEGLDSTEIRSHTVYLLLIQKT
jgi:hypothetical protein